MREGRRKFCGRHLKTMIGPCELEPQIWPTRSARSNQLSHGSVLVLVWPISIA